MAKYTRFVNCTKEENRECLRNIEIPIKDLVFDKNNKYYGSYAGDRVNFWVWAKDGFGRTLTIQLDYIYQPNGYQFDGIKFIYLYSGNTRYDIYKVMSIYNEYKDIPFSETPQEFRKASYLIGTTRDFLENYLASKPTRGYMEDLYINKQPNINKTWQRKTKTNYLTLKSKIHWSQLILLLLVVMGILALVKAMI